MWTHLSVYVTLFAFGEGVSAGVCGGVLLAWIWKLGFWKDWRVAKKIFIFEVKLKSVYLYLTWSTTLGNWL